MCFSLYVDDKCVFILYIVWDVFSGLDGTDVANLPGSDAGEPCGLVEQASDEHYPTLKNALGVGPDLPSFSAEVERRAFPLTELLFGLLAVTINLSAFAMQFSRVQGKTERRFVVPSSKAIRKSRNALNTRNSKIAEEHCRGVYGCVTH